MESSYRIIKKKNFDLSEGTVPINSDKTAYRKEVKDFADEGHNPTPKKKPEPPSKDEVMADFLQDLEKDREKTMQDIIAEAKEQARGIKDKAIQEGYMEGHSRGYRVGIEESTIEGENIKARAISVLKQCEEEAEKYFELQKHKIIQLAGDMAKIIVNHEIDTNDETVIDMIKPIIQDYKRSGMVVISCRTSHQKILKEKIKVLKAFNPELEFIILKNPHLNESAVTLEYQNQITDLNVADQIKSMVEELQNLEV